MISERIMPGIARFFSYDTPLFAKPLLAALILSLSWNGYFVYLTIAAFPDEVPTENEILTLELLDELSPILNEIRRQIVGGGTPQTPVFIPPELVTGPAAKPLFDRVRLGVSDPEVDGILREIKSKIMLKWLEAKPPTWGRLLLVVEVGTDGHILRAGLNRISGPPGLEDFIYELVNSAAPFSKAMDTRKESLWVEMEFAVHAMSE